MRQAHRKKEGFSLATVLIVVSLSSLLLSGIAAMVLGIYRDVSRARLEGEVKNIAESASDYYITKLNNIATRPDYDCDLGETKTIPISPSSIGAPSTASITASLTNTPAPDTSALYEERLDPDPDPSHPTRYPVFSENPWRVLKTTVIVASVSKSLTIFLKPHIPDAPQSGNRPFFQYGVLGTQKVEMTDATTKSVKTDSVTPVKDSLNVDDLAGDVRSLDQMALNGATIGGDVRGDSIAGNGTINGTGPASPGITVHNSTNTEGYGLTEEQNTSDFRLPPALEAPSTISDSHRVSTLDGTQTLEPGDYTTSSINLGISNNINNPMRIFLQDAAGASTSATTPVTVHANINPAGDPTNFQIWYSGSGTLKLDGSSMRALIYAPNATVEIGSSSSARTEFRGSVIAQSVKVENTDLIYYTGLRKTTTPNPGFSDNQYDLTSQMVKFRAVSTIEN